MDENSTPETPASTQSPQSDSPLDGQAQAITKRKRGYSQDPRAATPETQARVQATLADNREAARETRLKNRRRAIAQYVAWKSLEPNLTVAAAAKRMNLTYGTFKNWLNEANREGWLKFQDPLEKLEYELIPKVINNLNEFLDKKDRTVTLETAKGTVFKQFQAQQGISEGQMVLAIKMEAAPSTEDPKIISGIIVGTPKGIDE